MFSKLFGFIFILGILYVLALFVIPDIADTYGNKELNSKIRNIKNGSLEFASGADNPASLFEKMKESTSTFIKDTKNNIQGLETTVDTKVKQVNEASIAIENAYSGVVDATRKIQNLTGTGNK